MKQSNVTLLDLHYDILKEILIGVARSSDGAKHFANTISVFGGELESLYGVYQFEVRIVHSEYRVESVQPVRMLYCVEIFAKYHLSKIDCKAFQQYVEDVDVLRAVNFDNIRVSDRWELFQLREGLTCRCARSGQTQAQLILAKIILVSTSQLLMTKGEYKSSSKGGNLSEKTDKTGPKNFMEIFQKKQSSSDFFRNILAGKTCLNFIGHHFDYVKIFLLRAGCCEFTEMKPHIKNYMSYFILCMDQHDHEHHKTMQHLVDTVDRQLFGLESYCIHKRFISRWLEFSTDTRKLCLTALALAEDCRVLRLKKELLGTIKELGTEESEEVCCGGDYFSMVVAKLDIILKRFRAVKYVLECLCEASQNWPPVVPLPDELTRAFLLNSSKHCLEKATGWLTHFELAKDRAITMLKERFFIISIFHRLFREPC